MATEPPNSSINAPIHKFRWVHYPGSFHQGKTPAVGPYTYTVTPRFFDSAQSLLPIDPSRSVAVTIDVEPFTKKSLEVGFARGFTQSQAFVHHFGKDAIVRPKAKDLLFDTTQVSGTGPDGKPYTFDDEYDWLGFTARRQVFAVLNEVLGNKNLRLDVCAYDLNEPDIMDAFLTLAKQGRIRIILDNASLHHNATTPKPEDQFETEFTKAAKAGATIVRGKFGNFAHNKLLIVSNKTGAVKVLSGSTNFSVTGVYVNANHVLLFNDKKVAAQYLAVFEESLTALAGKKSASVFAASPEGSQTFSISTSSVDTPKSEITFAPHDGTFATQILDAIVARIDAEGKKTGGSVLFAVMQLSVGTGPVIPALKALHAGQSIFTYGISDSPGGIALYSPARKTGLLVTGKPVNTQLPPPFDQMVDVIGLGHQVHHKFIVCGFNSPDAVVYCGSSTWRSAARRRTATTSSPSTIATWPPCSPSKRSSWSITSISSINSRSPRPDRRRPRRRRHLGRTAGSCPRRTSGPRSSSTPTTCGAWTAYSSAEAIVFGFRLPPTVRSCAGAVRSESSGRHMGGTRWLRPNPDRLFRITPASFRCSTSSPRPFSSPTWSMHSCSSFGRHR